MEAPDSGLFVESDRKRESRLTNIIDQLRSNKADGTSKSADSTDKGNNDSETGVPHVSLSKALPTTTSTKARRKKVTRPGPVSAGTTVKNERCSPDPIGMGTESSRSDSPNSPSGGSFRTQSFASSTTPPINSSFTPPDRFNSPGNYSNGSNNKIVMEGLHMSRNYSDFMRSLAAKYNNNNNNQDQPVRPATNSFNIPLLDPRFSSSFKGNSFPHILGNLPLNNKKDLENLAAAAAGTKKDLLMPSPLSMMTGGPQHHIPGFPMMMDMSSTQALLNIVRSASAQNAQQLESYLRGAAAGTVPTSPIVNNNVSATKRSAETAGLMSSPLDLSASMVHKRPYMEPRGALKSPLVAGDYPAGKVSPPSSRSTPTNRGDLNARRVTTPKTVQPSPQSAVAALPMSCRLSCAADACTPGAVQVRGWAVAEVVDFVKSIDLCTEYAQVFREHSIDGSTLPLLTEEHLMSTMNMKLGPALKLRSVLASKIGHCAVCLHCVHCHHNDQAASPPSTSPVAEQTE